LIANAAAKKIHRESLSPEAKAQILQNNAVAHKNNVSLFLLMQKLKFYRMMLLHTKNDASFFLLMQKLKFKKRY
jgi:hypothetical protein